ncbi:hypothetical protein MASR1M65_12100 [Saprospiraceae bacterium]
MASGILTGKYLDEFPQNTRMSLETVGRLKEKALTEAKLNIIRQLDILAKETGISLRLINKRRCLKNPEYIDCYNEALAKCAQPRDAYCYCSIAIANRRNHATHRRNSRQQTQIVNLLSDRNLEFSYRYYPIVFVR